MQPEFNAVTLKADGVSNPTLLQQFLSSITSQLTQTLRGPVSIDLGTRSDTQTIEPYKADVTMLELSGDVVITLAMETRIGARGEIELSQDDAGGWVPQWANASGPNGSVDPPAVDAHQKTLYVARFMPDGWLVTRETSNYRAAGSDVGITKAIVRMESAMDPLPRTQSMNADYAIDFDGEAVDRPDSTATTLNGMIEFPASETSSIPRAYTTYASSQMFAKADNVPATSSDTPYPKVNNVVFLGPPSPNYFIYGRTSNTAQLPPTLAPGTATGPYFSPFNWHVIAGVAIADSLGAYVKGPFTGTSLRLNVDTSALVAIGAVQDDYPWISVSIDGGARTNLQVTNTGGGTVALLLASGLTDTAHTYDIVAQSRSSLFGGSYDLWPNPNVMLRLTATPFTVDIGRSATGSVAIGGRTMLFYGASADEAFPASAVGSPPRGRAAESWVRQVASAFGAEFGIVAYNGQGLLQGSWGVPGLTTSYDRHVTGVSRLSGGVYPTQPDIIVVTMGTNDDAGTYNDATFEAALVTLIGNLRAAAPLAKIIISADVYGSRAAALNAGVTTAADPNALFAAYNVRAAGEVINTTTYMVDAHPTVAGHAILAGIMRGNFARLLGLTTLSYQIRAEEASVLQGFYDVDDDSGWGYFNADGDETQWKYTLITYPGTISLLPAWTSDVKTFTVSALFELREAKASLEDADGAYAAVSPAPAFSAFASINGYLQPDGTLVAEVNPAPPGGVTSEARAYRLWNLSTNQPTGAPLYAQVPNRRVASAPSAQFDNLRIDLVRLTDHQAWIDTQNVDASGRFSIPKTAGERWEITLVNTVTLEILQRASITNGFPREFFFYEGDTDTLSLLGGTVPALGSDFEEVGFGYASAVVGLAYLTLAEASTDAAQTLAYQKRARSIAHGLMTTMQVDNGLPFAESQRYLSNLVGLRYYRTGSIAWEVYFALRALDLLPDSLWTGSYAAWKTLIQTNADLVLAWIYGQVDATGLVRFGTGQEVGGVLDPLFQFTNHASEHQFDAWFAFKARANRGPSDVVAPGVTYKMAADGIKHGLLAYHWRADVGRFSQDTNAAGVADPSAALDSHTWGALWLNAVGEIAKRDQAIAWFTAQYRTTSPDPTRAAVTGLCELVASDGVVGSTPSVWIEGTCGGLIAKRRAGTPDVATHTALAKLQQPDGSWRNFQKDDLTFGVRSFRSLQAAAWYILSFYGDLVFWQEADG